MNEKHQLNHRHSKKILLISMIRTTFAYPDYAHAVRAQDTHTHESDVLGLSLNLSSISITTSATLQISGNTTSLHVNTLTHIDAHAHTRAHACTRTHGDAPSHACMHTRTHTHTHTHTHTNTHTHTHSQCVGDCHSHTDFLPFTLVSNL